ncbi:ribonuclease T2 [Scyliorhinus canicula]|uniref:ribonuclease T2 n=1 Tax=Scyliorhinus canicula TaxID=7830 RepID=UPI0018F4DE02|nr:ribonuclease T2 [Scyliorhinus canicula]
MACQKGKGIQRKWMFAWIFPSLLVVFILPEVWDCNAIHPWHSIILSHHWPETVCLMVKTTCKIPPNVDYWTVHGLWPKKNQMCNNSWPFKIKNVEDILSELEQWWPDVLHPNSTQLWKHEWQKHGTCAATLESLDTQEKYFSKALELYQKIDLTSVLKKFDILPSSNYYNLDNIENAILKTYGVIPKIQCLPPTGESSMQILGQIELCFTKEFQLLNCTAPSMLAFENGRHHAAYLGFSECEPGQQIYYPPIQHVH